MTDQEIKEACNKEELVKTLESRVAELKEQLNAAEWELEKARGSGPMLDELFAMIDASDRSYEEVIEFLRG